MGGDRGCQLLKKGLVQGIFRLKSFLHFLVFLYMGLQEVHKVKVRFWLFGIYQDHDEIFWWSRRRFWISREDFFEIGWLLIEVGFFQGRGEYFGCHTTLYILKIKDSTFSHTFKKSSNLPLKVRYNRNSYSVSHILISLMIRLHPSLSITTKIT